MRVLVTSADSPKALSIIRSLGRHGVSVTTADSNRNYLSSLSKYSHAKFIYKISHTDELVFIHGIKKILKDIPHDVLMPVHSSDTYLLSKYHHEFKDLVKFPFTDYSKIMHVNDKGLLMDDALNLGILIPHTIQVRDISEIYGHTQDINYPCVIKLRNYSSSYGMKYVNNTKELIEGFLDSINKFHLTPDNYPIIQEYITGVGYGVSMLFNQGKCCASFTHKRIREYPIDGGPSSCRISVKFPEIEEIAQKLMTSFNWHGIVMVEFKVTLDNKPYLLEVNPRFWGSVNTAIAAGVDFPWLLYQLAINGDVAPVFDYKEGLISRNIFTDLASISQSFIKTHDKRTLKDFLNTCAIDDIFSWDDPLPVFSAVLKGIRGVKSKLTTA